MTKDDLAKSKYHGPEQYNCTQAVLAAFQSESGMSDTQIQGFSGTGGGRAEGGVCGAIYAARTLLNDSQAINHIENELLKTAGSISCVEIVSSEKLSCHDCVGLIARLLSTHIHSPETP